KGDRWSEDPKRPGTRDAKRRNSFGNHSGTWQTKAAAGGHLSATVQPRPLSPCLWAHLSQRRCDDSGRDARNRGCHVAGENRYADRLATPGTLPLDSRPTDVHTQEIGKVTAARAADLVG